MFCTCSIISILSLDRVTGQINQSTPKWHTHIENFQSGKKVTGWINGSTEFYTYSIISIFSLDQRINGSMDQRINGSMNQQSLTHIVKFLYSLWKKLLTKSTNQRQNDTHILKIFSLAKKLPAESTDQQCFAHVV